MLKMGSCPETTDLTFQERMEVMMQIDAEYFSKEDISKRLTSKLFNRTLLLNYVQRFKSSVN